MPVLLSFLLLVGTVAACDETCIRDCLAAEEVTAACFADCSCDSPVRSRPFGHKIETETDAEYQIRDLAYTEYDWVEKHYGCDVSCATSCFSISSGQELVDCFHLCGCEELLRPLNQKAVEEAATQKAFAAPGVLQSAVCGQTCAEGCREDPEDSFAKCFGSCTRKLCAPLTVSLGPDSSSLPPPLVYLLACVVLVCAYLYIRPGKRLPLSFKSL